MADWYMQNADARAAWHVNFKLHRPAFEAKYPILKTMGAELDADCDWIVYHANARHVGDEFSQQQTKYFNTIAGTNDGADVPEPLNWAVPPGMPPEVKPGLEKRIRDARRETVGYANYAVADGELLGFETGATSIPTPSTPTDFSLETLSNFVLKAKFRKRGMDALKLQFRRIGGEWQDAGFLVSSPGTFSIAPSTPGVGEQIEVRAIYIKGNSEIGSYSDPKPAFIAP